jgi:hypothetical protein
MAVGAYLAKIVYRMYLVPGWQPGQLEEMDVGVAASSPRAISPYDIPGIVRNSCTSIVASGEW